jgi:hypothetical protein
MAQFKPGQSGNPAGRPVGSKNKITLLKESMELLLREEATPDDMKSVMRKALEMAMDGDRSMIKLILELHMSKGSSQDTGKAVEKVNINISGPTNVKKEETVPLEEVALLVGNVSTAPNGA